ncbi:wall-associated receptor kinase-like 20 isoform X2 [Selaginella moellendorffii]|uniref:wall-associated receptor kinase-like 20 isoform X2 n=1 Tax=Selaginella moellendorffii TaxID=88036 RepID=UPI000D1C96D2|nr:wall-associated receptor kinase-like 20 isoform X2 [Selaginella moellendorffii]|eukprot:XP_002966230.2 wall-associated receptor kinase-like 20 isoform X2 [Selaginella moellendorffii]
MRNPGIVRKLVLLAWFQWGVATAAAICERTSCGNVTVQYPFGLGYGCGSPGFGLSCTDSVLYFNSSIVGSIDYNGRSLVLSSGEGCPLRNLPTEIQICSRNQRNDGNGQQVCLLGYSSCCLERNSSFDGEGCMAYRAAGGSSSTVSASLGDFSLRWPPELQTRCDPCYRVGNGQCGYNSTSDFVCFCETSNTTATCSVTRQTNAPIIISGISGSVAIAVIVVVLVFGVSLSIYWKWKKNGRESTPEPIFSLDDPSRDVENLRQILSTRRGDPAKLYTLSEIDKATNGFDKEHKIGSGGFGTVYKGLFDDGSVLAIKRANHTSKQSSRHFYNEVAILSQVNHRNLLRLMGCCVDSDVPILVYEYIPNGNLFEHLHKRPGVLSWSNRLTIAIETAEALAYLHSAAYPPIYHRDVKSANILLDNAFTTKVADFGLSRLVPVDVTHVSTMVQGTPGYVDPEYHQTYQLTDKSDVYSFGVVLLEMVTGRKPVDFARASKDVNLSAYSVPLIRKGLIEEIVDPKLEVRVSGNAADLELLESIRAVANVAMACLAFTRDERPTMKRVLEELVAIRGSDGLIRTEWLEGEVILTESFHPSEGVSYNSGRSRDHSAEITAR